MLKYDIFTINTKVNVKEGHQWLVSKSQIMETIAIAVIVALVAVAV